MTLAKIPYAKPICERFSLYFLVKDSNYGSGIRLVSVSNATLRRLMECLVESEPEATEEEWARLFLQGILAAANFYQFLLLTGSCLYCFYLFTLFIKLCQQLLFSYLQLTCFYAAKQISNQLKQSPNLQLHYPLEDCFAIACEASLKPAKLLKNFDLDSDFPLYGYARKALNRAIKNQIVQEIKSKSVKLSDYGLLLSLNPSQLEQALQAYGIGQANLPSYRLVWQAFKTIVGNSATLKHNYKIQTIYNRSLTSQEISQIIDYYQQQCQRLSLKLETVTPTQIKQIIAICIKAVRKSQQKIFLPLENNWQATQIAISYDDYLVNKEKQIEIEKIKLIIQQKFICLERKAQICLLLWLGLEVNQKDLAYFLNLQKQYQVARQLQKYQKTLFKEVISVYIKQDSSFDLSSKSLKRLSLKKIDCFKECLREYSKDLWGKIVEDIIINHLTTKEKKILIKQVREQFYSNLPNSPVKVKLQKMLQITIEEKLKVKLDWFPSAESGLTKFMALWLEQNLAIFSTHRDR